MKSFVVIGLGRFGRSLAQELCALGNEVLAIDNHPDTVRQIADQVTQAVRADARDPEVLRTLGVGNFDCAVVAIGNDVGGSALVTLNLKEMSVPKVVCKAHSSVHLKVLEKMGADQVVIPEQQMALRLAQNLSNTDIVNFIELSPEYSIMERKVPRSWVGQTLSQLGVRPKYNLNIIAIRSEARGMNVSPGGGYQMERDDILVVLGRNEDIERLDTL